MGLTRIRAEQISDIDYKQAVRVITLSNVTLSGGAPAEVDGISLVTGDRVLVNGQSNAAQNGLYQVQTVGAGSNGTWVRTSDANQDGEIQPGMVVMVTQGTVYADTPWKLITNGEIIIGTTELTFTENYSLAFGNIFANGTAVIANVVSAPITFAAGDNISITGNNITKTVTFGVTGITTSSIANGTSNVDIATANGNVTTAVDGNNTVTVTSTGANVTGYLTATGNITGDYFVGNGSQLTGISTSTNQIFNGTSNVDIATADANVTIAVDGVSNVVVVTTEGITVQGNVVGNGIPTTTVSSTPPADPEQGDIWIDSDTAVQLIYFDDGNSSQWAEMEAQVSVSSGGTVDLSAVDQDIIPAANATYSLGNATNRWANLFLVGNTIDLGGAQIKSDSESGAIALIPAPTANVPNPTALVISVTGSLNTVETAGGEISGNAIANAADVTPPVTEMFSQLSGNYVIGTNYNALTVGPVTINTGAEITVPTGSNWMIL